jgi:hypothetical protein
MKKFVLLISLMICTASVAFAQSSSISCIKEKNGYYCLYNSDGRQYTQISNDRLSLVGYSSRLIVFKKDGYYFIYNADAKKIATLDVEYIGSITRVADDSFISQKKGFTYKWNSTGSKSKIID